MFLLLKKILEILPAKDKMKLVVLLVLILLGGVLEIFSIGLIAAFVSVVLDPNILFNIEWLNPLLKFLGVETSRDILVYGSILLIFIFLFKNTYIIFYKYLKARFVYNRYRSISTRLFEVYMHTPYAFHLRRNSADLIRNVSTEAENITSRVIMPLLQITSEGVMILGLALLLIIVEPVVTLVSLLLLGGTSFFILKMIKSRMNYYGEEAFRERAGMIKAVNEGVGGLKDVTVMNRQNWFILRFQKSVDLLTRSHIFRDVIRQSARPVLETVAIAGMLIITIFLMWEGRSIASLASVLALFALSIQRLLPAMNIMVNDYNVFRYYSHSVTPIHDDLMSLQKKKFDIEKIAFKEKIELSNVTYAYPETERDVLKNISLIINKGSAVGIVGSTGSGKTTLVDVVLGLLSPQKGVVKVDGEEIEEKMSGWQKNIGYIPQVIYLSDDTIKNNVAFGVPEEEIDEDRVWSCLEAAQLDKFTKELSQGVDTFIGERGVRLSGGQRQRIGIARALYNNPEVLVMDEATSSLDNVTEKFVIDAIEKLKKGRTLIIIAHRLSTVKNCDNLYVIKEGEVAAQGSYEELLKSNEDFQGMVDMGK